VGGEAGLHPPDGQGLFCGFQVFDYRSRKIKDRSRAQQREPGHLSSGPKTGKKFPVPVTKVGPLRSSTVSPKKGRQYTILFSNLGKAIKKGDKVSVIIGKFKVENLVVGIKTVLTRQI
jgi:hypothetical protein